MHRILVIPIAIAALLLAGAADAAAAGTVSREGSALVFRGGDGSDGLFVRTVEPPESGATVRSYEFLGGRGLGGQDVSVSAGPGCAQSSGSSVLCAAAGVEHIELLMGGGDDGVSAGSGTALAASVTLRGGPGDDSIMGDEKSPSGAEELFGDEGDDMISAFSRTVAAAMAGGPGNDHFIWEQTDRGIATSADGGPGDDLFDATNAWGPDSIVGGGGADQIDVDDRGRGDPDSVTCGPDAIARLKRDGSDHVSGCRLDAFATSGRRLKRAVRRWHRGDLAARPALRLRGLRIPRAGVVTARLQVFGPKSYKVSSRRVHARQAGPVSLTFARSARFRAVARTAGGMILVLRYRADGGVLRELVIQHGFGRAKAR